MTNGKTVWYVVVGFSGFLGGYVVLSVHRLKSRALVSQAARRTADGTPRILVADYEHVREMRSGRWNNLDHCDRLDYAF